MRKAVLVVLLLSAPVASACFQALDTTASSGQPIVQPPPESDAGLSTVILPGPPPFAFFDDKGQLVMSDTPCDATRVQAKIGRRWLDGLNARCVNPGHRRWHRLRRG